MQNACNGTDLGGADGMNTPTPPPPLPVNSAAARGAAKSAEGGRGKIQSLYHFISMVLSA
jgi:hypothetical protein